MATTPGQRSTSPPWLRPMTGRDPAEAHRVSTPLELFFDLCFVVAVAVAAGSLHHALALGHLDGLVNYGVAFFGIWWAWVNYSWFASAYDTDDVVFRLLTFVIMTGVLVLAAGIPAVSGDRHDFRVLVAGYVVMRLALVPLWLRVAHDQPECRRTARRYAAGVALAQVLWVLRTWLLPHGVWGWIVFAALVALELAVPWFAERAGPGTPWHRHHISERYQLFTIIVLGEVLLAGTTAISAALEAEHVTGALVAVIVGALLVVFGLWWIYFRRPLVESLSARTSFWFGYAHYFVFASVAAIGAATGAVVDTLSHHGESDGRVALVVLAASISTFLLVLGGLFAKADRRAGELLRPALTSAALLLVAAVAPGAAVGVLLLGVVVGLAAVSA